MISNVGLSAFLGKNFTPSQAISSVIFIAILFFYIFTTGSFFNVDISPLENRFNHHKPFLNYIFDKQTDQLVIVLGTTSWLAISLLKQLKIFIPAIYVGSSALAIITNSSALDVITLVSFPMMISLLIYNRFATRKILSFSTHLSLNYLAILFSALSIISLVISSASLFSLQENKLSVKDYAYGIFLLFSSLSQVLIFLLIMGSGVKLLIGKPKSKIPQITDSHSDPEKKSRRKILYLALILLLSVVLSLIPHYPVINPDNQVVGSDSGDYVTMLTNLMNSKDTSGFIHQAFVVQNSGDRPLTLVFLYSIVKLAPDNLSYAIDHVSIILVPALVLSVFLLTRELTSDDNTSLFAAFVTAVSFQALIGVYGGLYSNLFALVVGYFAFVFLIRFLKNSGRLNFIAYLSLMVAFVFSHVYTWTVLTLVMSIFLILMYKFHHYDKRRIILLSLGVILSLIIDVSRTIITAAQGGISSDVILASHGAGLYQLALSWATLTDTMQDYGGGQFGNVIILALCLYWLYKSNLREPTNILLAIFLSIGILPLLFGNDVIQSRVFYDIPFQIPAGIALAYLGRKTNGFMMTWPVCIWLFAISLRLVTNFYFVTPS